MFRGVALHTPHFMGDIMIHNIIMIVSSMGVIAFGFMCYMQGEYILTSEINGQCFDNIAYSSIWIDDLLILIGTAICSTLCFTILMGAITR